MIHPNDRSDEMIAADKKTKTVLFGHIEVLEFPLQIGDNPSVLEGCPITIGWKLQKSSEFDVDCYEIMRPSHKRRRKKQLRIPAQERTYMLLSEGCTLQEIAQTTLETLDIKGFREQRIQRKRMDIVLEALVMTGHKIKKVASLTQLSSLLSTESSATRKSTVSLVPTISKDDFYIPNGNVESL